MACTPRSMTARIVLVAMTSLLAAGATFAQSSTTPSAEQLEVFRNLPPEQQQAILDSMGPSQGTGTRRDRDLESPQTVQPRTGDVTGRRAVVPADQDPGREPRITGRDTVLLDARLRDAPVGEPRAKEETIRLQDMLERLQRGNPYRLDASGVLHVSGVAPIPLAGLTAAQATERLSRDPALREYQIKLALLPLDKLDAEALTPFGYDLFAGVPSTFAPVSDVPVPSEYVVGPGDRIEVQLIGNSKGRYSLTVNRDGRIMFPELGPVAVAGLRFEQMKARIEQRVAEQLIGTQVVVTMGDLRSIRVFVLGEAERPGSYTVSGLSTITNALFASGGVRPIGSLRNIQLKRNGQLVARLDLYDLLLDGDTSGDVRLLPGDVIFIPPVGKTAGVTGEIRRPAIYELKSDDTAADLLYLGGGLTPEADARLATLRRIDERRDRVVLDVDLTGAQARGMALRAGDVLTIPGARPTLANAVVLRGHVHRPTTFEHRNGMRLTDVLPSVDDLEPNADLHYVLIRRESPGSRHVSVLSADLERAWAAPATDANPGLQPRDQVIVFDLESGRSQYLAPILEELRRQAVSSEPSQMVRVNGRVRVEGEYPLEPGMTVSDLIRAGGGLDEQAFGREAELARYEVQDGHTRRAEVLKVDLQRALAGDPTADLRLEPFDALVVKQISEWSEREVVRLEGEVRFPGEYPIARGETLRSVIERAGGITPLGYPRGSLFTREYLKDRERQQQQVLVERMRQDLGSLALQAAQAGGNTAAQASETLAVGQTLLRELESAQPVGRLVIDLRRVLAADPGSSDDIQLRGGDRLRVPKRPQEVTVIGEVQNSTSHIYDPNLSRDDYIRMSGGTTQKADDRRIYVVRASGSVESGSSSRWFRSADSMEPGDTVVVPLDAERIRPLTLWTAVSTIVYNMAIAVAAVNSF